MHRTHRMSRTALGLMLVGLSAGGLASITAHAAGDGLAPISRAFGAISAPGQIPDGGTPAAAKPLVVSIGVTQRLQMQGKKEIKRVVNPKENVAVVSPV